jgi:ABC-2 type transport system permease protein
MKAFNKLLLAAFKQFFRDRTALFFTFAFPLLFMLIFGLAFSGEQDVQYDIGLVNNDTSSIGQSISQSLSKISIFKISSGEQVTELEELKKGNLQAVIVIPSGLESSFSSGQKVDIVVYYDPSRTMSSQVILSVLNDVVNQINQQISQQPVLLGLAEESIQTHELRNIDYLVPGILAMSVLFLGLFGALPLVDWREKQILKRLGATPLRRSTVITSQVFYRLVLALLQTLIIIAIAYLVFHVQMVGSWLLLLGLVILGTLTFVSLGYLAVSRVKTTEGAMPIIQLIQFPMLFLSGIFFPVEFFPAFMRPIVDAIPLTYLGDAFRQVMVEATPIHSLTIDGAVLVGWLVACLVLAIRFFRWE